MTRIVPSLWRGRIQVGATAVPVFTHPPTLPQREEGERRPIERSSLSMSSTFAERASTSESVPGQRKQRLRQGRLTLDSPRKKG